MKVALLVGSGNPAFGGVERHLVGLANGLVERGHRAAVLMGQPCPIDAAHRLSSEVEVLRLPVPDGRSFPAFAAAALRRLGRLRVDLVHTHLTYGLAAGVLARGWLRLPLVHTEHFLVRKSGDEGLRGGVGAALRGRADAVICVSRAVEAACRVAGTRPVRRVIYNGTEPGPVDTVRPASRRLLYVGRLEADKRVDVLLELVAALGDEGYGLDLVGTGRAEADLRLRASGLLEGGRVAFHGWQADVTPFLDAALALLLPAREGLPYAAIEAAARGLPVVAPADSGAAEVVEATGQGGLVTGSGAQAWAAAVRGLPPGPRPVRPLPEVFTRAHMVAATEGLYREVVGRRRPRGAAVSEAG